jgi:hypothetical protein
MIPSVRVHAYQTPSDEHGLSWSHSRNRSQSPVSIAYVPSEHHVHPTLVGDENDGDANSEEPRHVGTRREEPSRVGMRVSHDRPGIQLGGASGEEDPHPRYQRPSAGIGRAPASSYMEEELTRPARRLPIIVSAEDQHISTSTKSRRGTRVESLRHTTSRSPVPVPVPVARPGTSEPSYVPPGIHSHFTSDMSVLEEEYLGGDSRPRSVRCSPSPEIRPKLPSELLFECVKALD